MMANRLRPEPVSTTAVTPLRLIRKKSSRVWDVDADEPSSASPAWSSYRSKASEEDDTPTTSSSRRRSSVLAPASDSKARRASIWDSILSPDGLSDDDEDFSSSSPLHAFQQAFGMTDTPVDEGIEGESSDGSMKFISKPDEEELSSDSDDEIARLEHHLIAQKFDKNDELGIVGFMTRNSAMVESLVGWNLSARVAHKWRWFVLVTVHLRFADCAEQHEDLFHTAEHHSLLSSVGQPEEIHYEADSKPTRRATLFGNVIGVYETPVQEGRVKLTHCLGDEVADISQALRVLKSNTRHRVKMSPPLFYDDLRPGEPRYLPDASDAVEEGGLLAAIQTARRNRAKAKAEKSAQSKVDSAPLEHSNVPTSPVPLSASPRSPSTPTSPNLLDGRRVSRRLTLVSIGKTGSRASAARHSRNDIEMTAHVAHLEALREEQRMNKLHERKDRIHETMEYFAFRPNDIFQVLRQNFDPDGFAHCTNAFYAPANLLKREALRFNREIQFLLRTIWRATDSDDSGAIDESEFKALHSRITCALLGRAALDETVRFYLFKQDWQQDSKGFTTLNRSRLEDSFFTLADRFCVGIEASEYVACLNRLLSRIVKFDSDTGEVGLRSEDEIWALNDTDPLIDDKVFQFKSKKERDRDEKIARAQVKDNDRAALTKKTNMKETSPQPKRRLSSIPSYINIAGTSGDLNEEQASKFIVVFDWAPEDGEKDVMSLTRGEVVYSAKRSLNLSIGPPPDPEGWIFCRKVVDSENVFGWCPEGMVLFVTREKKEELFGLGSIHENIAANIDPREDYEFNSGFDSDDSSERVEVFMPPEHDERYGSRDKSACDKSEAKDLLDGNRTEAPTRAHSRQSDKMISSLSSIFGPVPPENPTPRNIPDQRDILSEAMPEASICTDLLSKTQPFSTLRSGNGRQRRLGGGNIQFPGYAFEPSQAMSELSSSQRLRGDHQLTFMRTQSASQKRRTMAGMALPQAQPAPHMVAAAARRYADSLKETSKFSQQQRKLHSTTLTGRATSAPAWPMSTRRQDSSGGSVSTYATARTLHQKSQRKHSLGSVASNTLTSSGLVSFSNNAPKSFESIDFGFTGVPQQVRPNLHANSKHALPATHTTSKGTTTRLGRSYFNEKPASNVLLSSLTIAGEPAKDVIDRAQDYAQTRYLTVGSRLQAPHMKGPKSKNRRHSRFSHL